MDEHERHIDLTDAALAAAHDATDATDRDRGSAWAELDETFFNIVNDVFPRQFCFGATVLLASNDELVVELPRQRTDSPRLSHEATLERLNDEIDRELELRRAMRRHPSNRRRF
jgi:hypothetical protein